MIPKIKSRICPVRLMETYLRVHKRKGPLFQFKNGKFLTREHVHNIFNKNIDSRINVNTHSLRIGGATLLSKSGVPEHVIQKIGRWASDCYKRYVKLTSHHVYTAYELISQHIGK